MLTHAWICMFHVCVTILCMYEKDNAIIENRYIWIIIWLKYDANFEKRLMMWEMQLLK